MEGAPSTLSWRQSSAPWTPETFRSRARPHPRGMADSPELRLPTPPLVPNDASGDDATPGAWRTAPELKAPLPRRHSPGCATRLAVLWTYARLHSDKMTQRAVSAAAEANRKAEVEAKLASSRRADGACCALHLATLL